MPEQAIAHCCQALLGCGLAACDKWCHHADSSMQGTCCNRAAEVKPMMTVKHDIISHSECFMYAMLSLHAPSHDALCHQPSAPAICFLSNGVRAD